MTNTVSIVMPCRNEAGHVERAVADALAQQHPGMDLEVLVAVGPSTDGTHAIVERLAREHPQVRLVENPVGVVPHGLNAAIRAAKGRYIVRMDAHSRYPSDYAAVLTSALERTGAENTGGVWETLPGADTDEAWAIAAALSSGLGVGDATFRLGAEGEQEVDTVPYGCFRRALFDRIGFFDEELVRNQDDELNGRIRKAGGRIVLLPHVVIRYSARDKLSKLWRMYREYGLFKPLVWRKLGTPATTRQFAPPLFVLALLGGPLLALWHMVFGLLWCALVCVYAFTVMITAWRIVSRAKRTRAWGWLAAAFATVHIAYGVGYLQGLVRFVLLRRRVRPEAIRTNR